MSRRSGRSPTQTCSARVQSACSDGVRPRRGGPRCRADFEPARSATRACSLKRARPHALAGELRSLDACSASRKGRLSGRSRGVYAQRDERSESDQPDQKEHRQDCHRRLLPRPGRSKPWITPNALRARRSGLPEQSTRFCPCSIAPQSPDENPGMAADLRLGPASPSTPRCHSLQMRHGNEPQRRPWLRSYAAGGLVETIAALTSGLRTAGSRSSG
jgi:hypothetical protein